MKKHICFGTAIALIACLVGCNPKVDGANVAGSGKSSTGTDTKLADSYSTSGNNSPSSTNAPGSETKQAAPGLDLSTVPANLKSDAYEFYGLGRTEPIKMSMVQDGSSTAATQTVRLTKVDKESVQFTISNEGGFQKIGEVVLKLDKEGIRVVTMNGQKADENTFELPNGLVKGKSWPTKMELGGSTFTGTNKVAGTESVTTPVGTYKDALVIVSTAAGTQNGQKVKSTIKLWLVKGRGQVRAEVTNVTGKSTQKISVLESK